MRLVAIIFCCTGAAAPVFTLPDDVIPRKHVVDLAIDPSKPTFDGQIRIEVELRKSLNEIWLDARDITPLEASAGGKTARAETFGDEFVRLAVDSPIGPGRT